METLVFQQIMEHLGHQQVDGLLVVVQEAVILLLVQILILEVLVVVDPV